jgi:hypothetical protein
MFITNRKEPFMTRYNVHVYREMKLRFDGIEAGSPEAAASIARDGLTEDAEDIADCDGETFAALVDVVGDEDFTRARLIDFDQPGGDAVKPTVVITVMGGLVQDVHSTKPVAVYVEDWDCPPDKPLVMDFESAPLTPEQQARIEQCLGETINPKGE